MDTGKTVPNKWKIPGRLDKYDRDEIRASHDAGISVEQLSVEYRRRRETILGILRRED